MLEEASVPYELAYVDIMKGAQKSPEFLALNPMGKLPVLVDDGEVITEGAAIALYLGDRYASGRLAPKLDDPQRGTYLRWSFFAPSVVEPAAMAKAGNWDVKPSQAGWGDYDTMLRALETAIAKGPFLLGDRFTMADVVLGGTLRYMLMVKSIEARPSFEAYSKRLGERPALQRAEAKNAEIAKAHGLGG